MSRNLQPGLNPITPISPSLEHETSRSIGDENSSVTTPGPGRSSWSAARAELDWRGFLTVDALRVLRANGYQP